MSFALSLTEITFIPGLSSSDAYRAAQASLMRSFRGSFNKYIIPCSVASGHATGEEGSGNFTCRWVQLDKPEM